MPIEIVSKVADAGDQSDSAGTSPQADSTAQILDFPGAASHQSNDGPGPDIPRAQTAALGYSQRGWWVIPIPLGQKGPALGGWQDNAAAVVFAHNHPSGIAEPSRADELLTQSLKSALALVDVRTLDHFVVGGKSTISFTERGLL